MDMNRPASPVRSFSPAARPALRALLPLGLCLTRHDQGVSQAARHVPHLPPPHAVHRLPARVKPSVREGGKAELTEDQITDSNRASARVWGAGEVGEGGGGWGGGA